jgi:hypothetical protein
MAKNTKNTQVFLYLGLGFIIVLVLLNMFITKTTYLPYTTQSPQSDGTKAILLLLNKEGLKASTIFDATPQGQGLMILVKPTGHLQEGEWQQILTWVARGNTLLLTSDDSDDLYGKFKYELIKDCRTQGTQQVTSDNPLLKDVSGLVFTGATRLKKDQSMSFAYGDDQGIYLAETAKGKGRVIFLTLPDLFTNKEINKQDNLILFLNIVRQYGQEGVFFNEFVHGYTLEKNTREMFTWPLRLVVIQLALGVLLLFYFWGKRFGCPMPLTKNKDQVSGDYVSSMANIYRQSRQRQLILESIYQGFRQDLAQYLGVPKKLPNEELVKIFSGLPRIDTQKLKNLLGHCIELMDKSNFGETALFTIVRDMEIWEKANLHSSKKENKS